MKAALLLILAALLALPPAAQAQQPAPNAEKMVTRFFWLPRNSLKGASGEPDEEPLSEKQQAAKVGRSIKQGEKIGSARGFFQDKGVEFPPGSLVAYSPSAQMVMVRDTQDMVDLMTRILEGWGGGEYWFGQNIRVEARLVEFDPALAAELELRGTFADLAKKLGAGLKFIYAENALTVSGNRSQVVTGNFALVTKARRTKTRKAAGQPSSENGVLELKAVIGPDQRTVSYDYHFDYATPGIAQQFHAQSVVSLNVEHGQIVKVETFEIKAPENGDAVRHFALLLRMEILDGSGRIDQPLLPPAPQPAQPAPPEVKL